MEPTYSPASTTVQAQSGGRVWLLLIAVIVLVLLIAGVGVATWVWFGRAGGGETVVLQVGDGDTPATAEEVDQVVEVLHQRVEGLGAGQARISETGENLLTVELPVVEDVGEAVALLEQPGRLGFHLVLGTGGEAGLPPERPWDADDARAPAEPDEPDEPEELTDEELEELLDSLEDSPENPDSLAADPADVELVMPDETGQMLQLGAAQLGNEAIEDAEAVLDQVSANWQINIAFTGGGSDAWQQLTGEAACYPQGDPRRRVAIVLDDQIISTPEVAPDTACEVGIPGGSTVVTGDFTAEEAETLASLIQVAPLPVEVEVVEGP